MFATGRISQSSAFAEGFIRPELRASVHDMDLSRIGVDKIEFRTKVSSAEIDQIRQLHAEWLPVDYNDEFFLALTNPESDVLSVIACLSDKPHSIIGMATVAVRRRERRYNFQCDLLPHLGLDSEKDSVAYILTFGIVDELRRAGFASALLKETMKRISESDPDCRVVFLHVIDYNEPAMRLYQKNGFVEFKEEPNFYLLGDTWYSGIMFYQAVRPANSWMNRWLQKVIPTQNNSS